MSYHHGLAGFDPAPFETMRPGEWTAQGVDPNLTVSPSQWNPTLTNDPFIVAQVNQMLASGINPVTGNPTRLNTAVLSKGYTWHGGTTNPFTGASGRPGDFGEGGNVIGNAFDMGLAAVQALPPASRGETPPNPEAAEFQSAPVYSGPPAGWHAGSMDGVEGYWAPDGLFYGGAEPWDTYTPNSGKSINTAQVKPLAVPMTPGGAPTNASGDDTETLTEPAPHPEAIPAPSGAIVIEYDRPDVSRTGPLTPGIPEGGPAPLAAGVSGKVALALGVGLAAWFLFGRKR